MSQIGCYHGVYYVRLRHADVFPHTRHEPGGRARWWFTLQDDRRPDGNHYKTKRQMFKALDASERR